MSIFDKLRNSFSSSKKKKEEAKGHVLGTTSDGKQIDPRRGSSKESSSNSKDMKEFYEITLNDDTLGCVIPYDNLVIKSVDKGSTAGNQGVKAGDVLISIDSNPVNDIQTLKMLLGALERPFQITLARDVGSAPKQSQADVKESSSSSGKLIPDMGILKALNGSTSGSSATFMGGSKAPPPLSSEEKEQRREAMMKAAAEREGAWSKKVKSTSAKRDPNTDMRRYKDDDRPVFDHSEAASLGSSNAETQRMVAAAKRGEQQMSQTMGYSPFAAQSSVGFATTTTAAPAPAPATSQDGGEDLLTFDDGTYEHLDEDKLAAVDGAFEMLFSSDAGEDGVLRAIQTVTKLLQNLSDNPLEAKYRRVRLENAAIRERIVVVAGAVEVLVAAGFEPEEQDGESVLVHAQTAENTDKARYVVSRLKELL